MIDLNNQKSANSNKDSETSKSTESSQTNGKDENIEISLDKNDDIERSLLYTESINHEVAFTEWKKEKLPSKRKIYLDYPAVRSFKSLVGVPQEIKDKGISQQDFLRARINLDESFEKIGLNLEENSENEQIIESQLAKEITELQKYHIPKSQKELDDAIREKQIWTEQTQNVLQSEFVPSIEPIILSLNEISPKNPPNIDSQQSLADTLNAICDHYDDHSFDINAALQLLSTLEQ